MKKNIHDALGLFSRIRESEPFRAYLQQRQALILGAGIVVVLVALACAAGVATFLAGLSTWMTLPALLLGSLVMLGSGAVQLFVFFSWLEGRALALALGKPLYTRHDIPIGPMPVIPWPAVAAFVIVPLLLLLIRSPLSAIVILLIGAAMPIAFAKLESDVTRRARVDDAET